MVYRIIYFQLKFKSTVKRSEKNLFGIFLHFGKNILNTNGAIN